jgi:DNA-binding NarL/FixJ family response regulator
VIRVLIADDHPMFRRGLRGVLEEADDVTVVGEATDGAEAVSLAVAENADVVLMDLAMATTGGIEATAELAARAPDVAVLVLTMATDEGTAHAALRAGARGYLVKGAAGQEILTAVRSVAAGNAVLGATVAQSLIARAVEPALRRSGPFPELTDRECEVLDLLARGLSNHEIARTLVLSDKTVRNHVTNLFGKLGVPDRARAIVLARERGLGA